MQQPRQGLAPAHRGRLWRGVNRRSRALNHSRRPPNERKANREPANNNQNAHLNLPCPVSHWWNLSRPRFSRNVNKNESSQFVAPSAGNQRHG